MCTILLLFSGASYMFSCFAGFQLIVLYFSSSIMMSSSPSSGSKGKRYMNPVSKPAEVIKSHKITWNYCLSLYVFFAIIIWFSCFKFVMILSWLPKFIVFFFNMDFQGYYKTCRATSSFWRIYRHPIFGKEFGKTIQ